MAEILHYSSLDEFIDGEVTPSMQFLVSEHGFTELRPDKLFPGFDYLPVRYMKGDVCISVWCGQWCIIDVSVDHLVDNEPKLLGKIDKFIKRKCRDKLPPRGSYGHDRLYQYAIVLKTCLSELLEGSIARFLKSMP